MKPILNGNKTNAAATLAIAWGAGSLIPEESIAGITSLPDPTVGMVLALVGVMFLTIRNTLKKIEARLPKAL